MNPQAGKTLIFIGIFVVLIGVVIYFFYDKFHWFGKLPGDIRVEKEGFKFYFPVTTMIVLSLLLTLIVNILRRL